MAQTSVDRGVERSHAEATVHRFRTILLGLAAVTCLGAATELAMLRHWRGSQLIPWVMLAVIAAGIVFYAPRRDSRAAIISVRIIAGLSVVTSAVGAFQHIVSNWETAPLSAQFATTWEAVPLWQQWWLAASGGAGAAPPLAPGFVALSGLCLALATIGAPRGS